MSEAIQPEQPPYPGAAWTEIVRRPTLGAFSRALYRLGGYAKRGSHDVRLRQVE